MAGQIGMLKTLVARGDRHGVVLAVVPGVRGTQIVLVPQDYVKVTWAVLKEISR